MNRDRVSNSAEVIARVRKIHTRDTLLGRECICLPISWKAKERVSYTAVYDEPYLIIVDDIKNDVVLNRDIGSINFTENSNFDRNTLVIEIKQTWRNTYIVLVTGRMYSILKPFVKRRGNRYENLKKRFVLSSAHCFLRIIDDINSANSYCDRLFATIEGQTTELLQCQSLFSGGGILLDEVTQDPNKFTRRAIQFANNEEFTPAEEWTLGYDTRPPTIHAVGRGQLIRTPTLDVAKLKKHRIQTENKLLLIDAGGNVSELGEKNIKLTNHAVSIDPVYPNIWMSTLNYKVGGLVL
jgi:hypothetical protein